MRLDPAGPPVRHQVGQRLAVAADDDGRAILLHPRQQARKVGFRFMDVDRFHGDYVSPKCQFFQIHLLLVQCKLHAAMPCALSQINGRIRNLNEIIHSLY
jgi:hypothetical protein